MTYPLGSPAAPWPVARPSSLPGTAAEDVADQLAKSIRVMLGNLEAGETLSAAADHAYAAALRFRAWCEAERAVFQRRQTIWTGSGRRTAEAAGK
ncbi:hypothetical protein ACM614_21965 [Streptomyces sp. 12297]